MNNSPIRSNYLQVLEQIAQAALSARRPADHVKLVVVTKGHPVEAVQEAVEAGVSIFGENYAEEGSEKVITLREKPGLEWHMIGHIQSRKARLVSEYFDWVHSLDSLKLASRLNHFAVESGRVMPVLLECNVSGEESKFGWAAWQEHRWESLLEEFAQVAALPGLKVSGLMTMAPYLQDVEQARPYFRRLRCLRDYLAQQLPGVNWQELSMGISADFVVAVQEGATMVRIGTAILGARPHLR
ncbi:MAG: YggS family pyridoxal phosphate-dependent enzyme [Anaerolineales bacterium]|nr:YggS family pyridoxal phosphate-dependent enzyme [Anaerolineales bacterium]